MFLQFSIRISILFIIQIILAFGSSLGDVALHKCPKFAKLREHRRECVDRWAERIQSLCIYPGQKTSCYNDINSYVQSKSFQNDLRNPTTIGLGLGLGLSLEEVHTQYASRKNFFLQIG
jgi:hypothetical protein